MAQPKVNIPDWHFACTHCGNCCRRWHVYVSPAEFSKLQALAWKLEDNAPTRFTTTISGHQYLAHRESGDCVFLDPQTSLCKIHSRFGMDRKPIGCRVYPLNIASTFDGCSAIPRFDCPAVLTDAGPLISQSADAIRKYAEEMGVPPFKDPDLLDGMDTRTAQRMVDLTLEHVLNAAGLGTFEKMRCCSIAIDRLEKAGENGFWNELDLNEVLPPLLSRAITERSQLKVRRLGLFEEWRFLHIFTAYLRRDEEVIGKRISVRVRRALEIARIYFAKGNIHRLGTEHPDFSVGRAHFFATRIENADSEIWQLYENWLCLKLQSRQFMGAAHLNFNFFTGLKILALSFPLVVAAAKWSAMARDTEACVISRDDVAYAVGAIDHSFGRSALLKMGAMTVFSLQMTPPEAYARILNALR